MPVRKTTTKRASSAKEAGSLERYHAKRDFGATPEPRGEQKKSQRRLKFVIQKHRASRLHYDFRLEADGVLKSWAVPKGPSLNPADKRLAMHVEDHPMDYRTFEGVIPKGNYGAGEVIVWDEGTWDLVEGADPTRELAKGKLVFFLHGKKLQGEFALVRIKGRGGESGDPWLLIKHRDEYVNPKYSVDKDNKSVKTGRTVESYRDDEKAKQWKSGKKSSSRAARPIRAAKRDPLPRNIKPMLATLVDEPFDDPDWFFEIKWDGYRAICTVLEDGTISLISRNGLDFLAQFPELEELKSAWTTLPIIVDGEIVSLDERGRSSFQRLQGSFNRYRPSERSANAKGYPLTYAVFDVLYADGKDIRKEPLEERKAILERSIAGASHVMYSKHVAGKGCALFKRAQEQHLEGIIGKRRDSPYMERRTRDWVKIKAQLEQECVIGGYTEPRGSRKGFGALLVGLYERGKLHYVGHVGTGFDTKTLAALTAQLRKLEKKTSPFVNDVQSNTPAHWVDPKFVAQIRFTEWTRDGVMRQPAFLGLRVDKNPKSCVRERPVDTDEIA